MSWDDSASERRVRARGEIDIASVDRLQAALDSTHLRIHLDLGEVEFMDLTGLRCLIDAAARAEVSIVASSPVWRVLEVTGTGDHFSVERV